MLVIDDDVSQVVIRQTGLDTVVGEDGATDSYTVELSAAPSATVEVRIAANSDVCLSTAVGRERRLRRAGAHLHDDRVGPDRRHRRRPRPTAIVESFEYARLEHTVDGAVVGFVTVLVTDRDVPDVLITESDGATQVAEGIGLQDSYTVVLTRDPGAETVTVTATSLPTITQYDPEDGTPRITRTELQVELSIDGGATWHTSVELVFTTGNWSTAQTVLVRAVEDAVIDGRILQAFPDRARRVHAIQGVAVRRRRRLRLRLPARQLPAGAAAGRDQLPARHHSERGVRRGRGPRGRPPHRQQPGRRRRPVDDVDLGRPSPGSA